MQTSYDIIVIGAGAAGMMAAIAAARQGRTVLLLEKLARPAAKLKATGGGRCNLTNTLENVPFMERFGKQGRFMTRALEQFDHKALMAFFEAIGVESHAPDGYRVFPKSHSAMTIIAALEAEMAKLGITLLCSQRVEKLLFDADILSGVTTQSATFKAPRIIIATGGMGYPQLGAEGDGYGLAGQCGHTITTLYPAMMPLHVKETWVASCRADTLPKVHIRIDLPKAKKITTVGDLIFTKNGIRGPVVLDVARELTPLLEKHAEVPILLNFTKGMNEEEVRLHLKKESADNPHRSTLELLLTLLPESLAQELCQLSGADATLAFGKLEGRMRDALIKLLAWTPLHVTGHEGFKMAMITRGGVSLKQIDPETMQSRLVQGLYFCGEVMDLDGPCGGYNLQWSFASGHLSGSSAAGNF